MLAQPQIVTQISSPTSPAFHTSGVSPHTPRSCPQTPPESGSPHLRHPVTRPLSPDLPTRDALYLFCNFSSYMRSPQEGAEGITDNTDFHDTIRLLDYARTLSSRPGANVSVLHMKYRFQTPDQGLPSTRQEKLRALNYRDQKGRQHQTVSQPFSTLHDPVVKIDYQDNGIFNPLPAQAVFAHIAKFCRPTPRVIVVSYVSALVTENHIASLAAWAVTSAPPIYVFSPLETRLREARPLQDALHHAIPISMYAWPADTSQIPSPSSATSATCVKQDSRAATSVGPKSARHRSAQTRRASTDSRILPSPVHHLEHSPRSYPPDPVATLSVLTESSIVTPSSTGDRLPLWLLAPGIGVMQGSTSASLGIKLSDFSAINLVKHRHVQLSDVGKSKMVYPQNLPIDPVSAALRTSPMSRKDIARGLPLPRPPLDPVIRSRTATPEPISRPGTAPGQRGPSGLGQRENGKDGHTDTHLMPHNQDPRHLSPPEPKARSLGRTQQSWPQHKSFPTLREQVSGWRRGRREVMEDALDEQASGEVATGGGVTVLQRKLEDMQVKDEDSALASEDKRLLDVDEIVLRALNA